MHYVGSIQVDTFTIYQTKFYASYSQMTQLTHISGSVFHFWVTHICDLSLFPPKNPLLAPTNSIAHYFPPDEECSCAKWVEGLHCTGSIWIRQSPSSTLQLGLGLMHFLQGFLLLTKKSYRRHLKIPTTYIWACLHCKRISRNPEGAFFSFPLTSTSKTLSFIILQTATGVGTIYGITSTILKVFQNPSSYLAFKRIHMPAKSF